MANINELLAQAAALRDETALNSISPERAGSIMYGTLLAMNELWLQQGAALVISKIYASVSAMEADTAPVSDLTGQPLRSGQIVVIASSDSDNGSVYRYNGTESPSWSLVGNIGNLQPVDSLDSDSTSLPLAAHQGKVLDGKISQLGQDMALVTEGKYDTTEDAVAYSRLTKGIALPFRGKCKVTFVVKSGSDSGQWKLFRYVNGSIGAELLQNTDFGVYASVDIPESDDGVWLLTTLTSSNVPAARTYEIRFKDIEGTIPEQIDALQENLENCEECVGFSWYPTQETQASGRLSKSLYIGHPGETAKIKVSVVAGTDGGKWKLYGTSLDGSSIDTNVVLVQETSFADSAEFIVPANGYVWIFTIDNTISTSRTYSFAISKTTSVSSRMIDLEESISQDISDVEAKTENLNEVVGISWYPDTVEQPSGRVSKSLYLGHGGKSARMKVSVVSGTDTGKWALYGTSADGSSIDTGTVLAQNIEFGNYTDFTVPSNGFVWLFTTAASISTSRSYKIEVSAEDSILSVLAVNEITEQKTIVCFGDSITEFIGNDGKRYTDWLAEMTGANVINVGIGGTQLRQRQTPSATPTTVEQCYAGLDIVSLVDAAMDEDFTIPSASATELATLTTDDNTAIVTRLQGIDWSKVDYVTILGGTNDWANNNGNTGGTDTTDISYTCGAINHIIDKICSAYTAIKVYWFTPLLRFIDAPVFSSETAYDIGDLCTYNGQYYRFTSAHQGVWDSNDVEQVTRASFRIPEYSSDNVEKNGKTLREFSELIASVVKNNHIPVCDLYDGLGWNMYNFSQYFYDSDNTHPYKGFREIAEKIMKFIDSN